MKVSKYNMFYFDESKDSYIAYNSFTNALAYISLANFRELEKYIYDPSYQLQPELINELVKGGFLTDDSFDELAILQHRINVNRYATSCLSLTIAPTSACNFRCIYCYEKGSENQSTMTVETQNALVAFVEDKAKYIKKLNITWYGGEPLLAMDIITSLSVRFMELAKKYKLDYSAAIITNGYLMTLETAHQLVKLGITSCQITLDGCEKNHNNKRPHMSGSGTFQQIISNVISLDNLPELKTSLRINIDKNNLSAAHELNALLKSNQVNNILVYISPIRNSNDCHPLSDCMSKEEFFEFEFEKILAEKNDLKIMKKYPKLRGNVCCADAVGAYVIAADGEIYKCWSDIGRKNLSIGNICNKSWDIMNEILYIKYDPTQDRKCRSCKFLPICMGGCPFDVRTEKYDRCFYYESTLKKYLLEIAKRVSRHDIIK